ncbi:MAG: hypothetical protein PWR01_1583 [Clostridiales bacterium]|jgi:hypothetical protein|nr:hypothetical protein [Clostridiales bacterium]
MPYEAIFQFGRSRVELYIDEVQQEKEGDGWRNLTCIGT